MNQPATLLTMGEYCIRRFQADDVEALIRYANNRNVSINLRDIFPYPYERRHAEAWLGEMRKMNPETAFAIATAEELIGGILLHPQSDVHRRSAEIGYWLAEPYWGRGIATRAVEAMTEWGFAHLDINRIYAHVFGWNPASARVLEKVGYVLEGRLRQAVTKDGQVTDLLVYGMVR